MAVGFDVHDNRVRQEGLEFANRSSRAMNNTLDLEETVQAAWQSVPSLGDWASIYLYEPGGSLRRYRSTDSGDAKIWTTIDSAEGYIPEDGSGARNTDVHLQQP